MRWFGKWSAILVALVTITGPARPGDGRHRAAGPSERAIEYFVQRGERTNPLMVPVLAHLRRRFGIARLDPLIRDVTTVAKASDSPFPLRMVGRLLDSSVTIDQDALPNLSSPTDRLITAALHCDRFGLGPDFDATLDQTAAAGGYYLTHAALALEWTIENRCRARAKQSGRQRRYAEGMAELVEREGAKSDLAVEAIAMLYYTGFRARVETKWIKAVIAAQRSDGGWAYVPNSNASDHTTVLGLWVLLEAEHPGLGRSAWIPRQSTLLQGETRVATRRIQP